MIGDRTSGSTPPGARAGSGRAIALAGGVLVAVAALVIAVRTGTGHRTHAKRRARSSAGTPAAPPPSLDQQNHDVAVALIKAALVASGDWMHAHPHGPCPAASDLVQSDDPWGSPLVVTCTDQPADQQLGVKSLGPDRSSGTDDDLDSWALGNELTQLVRGARWQPAPADATKP